ncbi:MAG: hypothetical protein B1H04_00410 [Planctomycetales bacterium 4484_123]|nr:MAG: hypothetical protein B1H04_00410 [Planctomycetales bacterium 4484_123]
MPATGTAIRAVVFDLDDTLFRERDYVLSGFRAVAEHLGRPEEFTRWMWRRFQAGRRGDTFDALSEHFGLGLSRADIAALVELYRAHVPRLRPCRGVIELLRALRRRGRRLGLLSDGYLPAQRLKLSALGLEGFFHAVVFTEELARQGPPAARNRGRGPHQAWKPSAVGFERIRRRLGVPHRACAYVGDNPAKDFLAPNELGWLTVQWRRPGQLHADNPPPPGGKPWRIVRSGPELLRLLGHPRRT